MELLTTPQTFGDQLHTYTIVDAINDGNVLPFRIDYVNTVKEKENIRDKNVSAIDIEKAMGAPERIREIVKYTLEHFDQKTKRNSFYSLKGKRMAGFNAMFAVSSIPMAMKYYTPGSWMKRKRPMPSTGAPARKCGSCWRQRPMWIGS